MDHMDADWEFVPEKKTFLYTFDHHHQKIMLQMKPLSSSPSPPPPRRLPATATRKDQSSSCNSTIDETIASIYDATRVLSPRSLVQSLKELSPHRSANRKDQDHHHHPVPPRKKFKDQFIKPLILPSKCSVLSQFLSVFSPSSSSPNSCKVINPNYQPESTKLLEDGLADIIISSPLIQLSMSSQIDHHQMIMARVVLPLRSPMIRTAENGFLVSMSLPASCGGGREDELAISSRISIDDDHQSDVIWLEEEEEEEKMDYIEKRISICRSLTFAETFFSIGVAAGTTLCVLVLATVESARSNSITTTC